MEKKLYRSKTNKILAGVCGGLEEYLNLNAWIFRILFLITGIGLLLYIILWLMLPVGSNAASGQATQKSYTTDEWKPTTGSVEDGEEWETPNPSAAKIAQEDQKNNNNNTFTLG